MSSRATRRLCIAWRGSATADVAFFKVSIICHSSIVEVSGCSSGLLEHSSCKFNGDSSLFARR